MASFILSPDLRPSDSASFVKKITFFTFKIRTWDPLNLGQYPLIITSILLVALAFLWKESLFLSYKMILGYSGKTFCKAGSDWTLVSFIRNSLCKRSRVSLLNKSENIKLKGSEYEWRLYLWKIPECWGLSHFVFHSGLEIRR